MMSLLSFKAALVTYGLFLSVDSASGNPGLKLAASPGYRGRDVCPQRCTDVGPSPGNWSRYHNLDQFDACPQAVIQAFSTYDDVDDASSHHGIYACSSYGPDFANLPKPKVRVKATESLDVKYEVGWWDDGRSLHAGDVRSATKQIRHYLSNGHGASNTTEILYARSGRAAVGVYLGSGLQNDGVSASALKILEDNLEALNVTSRSVAMQFCQSDYTSEHIFGFFATDNKTFAPVQQAIKSWSNATCLTFANAQDLTGKATLVSPIVTTSLSNATTNSTSSIGKSASRARLHARSECSTMQVQSGDSCGSLAEKCGISAADFTKYNSDSSLCSSLAPGQHVCCSDGDLPDFTPKPNDDGSCSSYYVVQDDNCSNIAAANSLTNDDLEDFNKNTWAWNGCDHLQFNMNICLSEGDPPMPAELSNAVCGPQKPGTTKPTDGTELADLNPCPLNACCDVWGQCGITAEFCTDTGNGTPGTAEPGTNGCISNCGTDVIKGDPPSTFRKVAYYEGFGLKRDCLFQDILQIEAGDYTHLHFAFGTLTADYEVEVGDVLSSYEFDNFKRLDGPARILSFGGWAFSTDPATYTIFREGVTSGNRLKMAQSIATFITDNDLDGVDIDWEYPGAPDIPGIPAASEDDGANYLAFLVILKNLLPGKSVSIAAPSSYWYLKAYPLKEISQVIDYIVYMTYDLHGQWDAQNPNSQEGCDNGNCLRSQVNLTETMSSLVMITKAEVPSGKVVVGVTSYGRAFSMADSTCFGPTCQYTGGKTSSDATPGKCTNTAGYIADAEIREIIADTSRVNQHFVDDTSHSNILVYDNNQWVAYMDDDVRTTRQSLYSSLGMGGTTNWASDLETYNDVPRGSDSWADFKLSIKSGKNPWQTGDRNGNWTDVNCDDQAASDIRGLTPSERWSGMDCEDAWNDIIDVWKNTDRDGSHFSFTESVSLTINGPPHADCGTLLDTSNCGQTEQCDGFQTAGSGPAGWEIWNSLVIIHEMYKSQHDALYKAAAAGIDPALKDFENHFAPVPPAEDDTWLRILIDLVTLGASAALAPFLNSFLKELPYFLANKNTFDNVKDWAKLAVSNSGTIAKDLLSTPESEWSESSQAEFSTYLGQTITAWGNITSVTLEQLFDGTDESIDTLHALLTNGKMISGGGAEASPSPPSTSESDLEAGITKLFFAYAIPTAWTMSSHWPFVIDSGYDCGVVDPLDEYLDTDTMHLTAGCYEGKLYYIAMPDGDSTKCQCTGDKGCQTVCTNSKFSAPPGLDSIDGSAWGGVTVTDLIAGSVRTYLQNGNANGGEFVDATNDGSLDDLMDNDVTTPGLIRMPVCSPEQAYKSWDTSGPGDDATYPCNIAKGPDHCQSSSFENESTDASPLVSDCKQIVTNIQGDGGATWTTGIASQRELVSFGSCHFGVESVSGADGDVTYKVGAQDVIDIINEAIKQFGGSGVIGAKGQVDCDGNVHDTTVEWGIY